jgi:hypothetical protein
MRNPFGGCQNPVSPWTRRLVSWGILIFYDSLHTLSFTSFGFRFFDAEKQFRDDQAMLTAIVI